MVFHCDTGKGLSAQQLGPSKLSHLGIGLRLNTPCVRLITYGCGDTAYQGCRGGCRFVGKVEVESISFLLSVVTHLFNGVDGGVKQALGWVKHSVD